MVSINRLCLVSFCAAVCVLGCSAALKDAAVSYTDHYVNELKLAVLENMGDLKSELRETISAKLEDENLAWWEKLLYGLGLSLLTGGGIAAQQKQARKKFHGCESKS